MRALLSNAPLVWVSVSVTGSGSSAGSGSNSSWSDSSASDCALRAGAGGRVQVFLPVIFLRVIYMHAYVDHCKLQAMETSGWA